MQALRQEAVQIDAALSRYLIGNVVNQRVETFFIDLRVLISVSLGVKGRVRIAPFPQHRTVRSAAVD
jgi:hypothetical protein